MNIPAISVAQARALDRDATERLQMPSLLLMENAARGVAEAAAAMGERFLVLCGPGNNGGDGLAAARHLGLRARVYLLAEPDPERSPDAHTQLRILRAAGHPITVGRLPDAAHDPDLDPQLGPRHVWIDALFGTGLTRPLEGEAARWVPAFNDAPGPKLSVDIPSGLHGDSGEVLGIACRADVTVTFAAPKKGLLTPRARPYVGKLIVAPLGVPAPARPARP